MNQKVDKLNQKLIQLERDKREVLSGKSQTKIIDLDKKIDETRKKVQELRASKK